MRPGSGRGRSRTESVEGRRRRGFAGGQHVERRRAIDGAAQFHELLFLHAIPEGLGSLSGGVSIRRLNAFNELSFAFLGEGKKENE